MIVYKLTDQNMKTYNGFQWELGQKYVATGPSPTLCTAGLLHGYADPLLAVLHNPIHANYKNPRLFRAKTFGLAVKDGQLKLGSSGMMLIKELLLPVPTQNQRVAYGILCALEVYKDSNFTTWAKNWLSGKDRTAYDAAHAAYAAAHAAAYAAHDAAEKKLNLIRLARKAMKIQ